MKNSFLCSLRRAVRGVAALMLVLALVWSSVTAYAAGSRNLTSDFSSESGSWVSNAGYRPYTEWYGNSTAKILRHQIIKAYVKTGETIFFGSSVVSADSIVVRRPDGSSSTEWTVGVTENGAGHIATRAMELAGANYIIGGIAYNVGGYNPLSIVADLTGVWEFEFHSVANTIENPKEQLVDKEWEPRDEIQKKSTVAAWDVTVVKIENELPREITGRVFATYLSLNMGNNLAARLDVLNSTVYVLTKDGYVYRTDFNGMNPFGFIFFANNRGLVNTVNNTALYHSARDPRDDNNVGNLADINAGFHLPTGADTPLDWTYKIFFEEPADDLPEDIKPIAYAPESVTDFYFEGDAENHGIVGSGGYFYFTVTRASSFQIKIDMTEYTYVNSAGDTVNGGIVYIANACTDGVNRVYWDGKDEHGVDVPAGIYGTEEGANKIKITVQVKSGEYHFPIIDAECNKNGIIIELLTNPLDNNGNEMILDSSKRSLVYYDNSKVVGSDIVLQAPFGLSQNQLEGMDSSVHGASAYTFTKGNRNTGGDCCVIDIWTYFGGDIESVSATLSSLTLEDPTENIGSIDGFVFYDMNKNGKYSITEGDYALGGVTVTLSNGDTAVTDFSGYYSFEGLDYGDYSVSVVKPGFAAEAECTTANQTQGVTLNALRVRAEDVGFHYSMLLEKNISVEKLWTVGAENDPGQPSAITVSLLGKNHLTQVTEVSRTAILSQSNEWKYVFTELPKYDLNNNTLDYTVQEEFVDANGNAVTGYTSTVSAPVESAGEIQYTVTNTPTAGIIKLVKTDAESGERLEGARFELWKKGSPDTLVDTLVTDKNGVILVAGLDFATYYFSEVEPPEFYEKNGSGITEDIVLKNTAVGCFGEATVPNTFTGTSFTITKTTTERSAQDESFVFRIDCPDGTSSSCVITVPAGQTSATKTFIARVRGEYTVTELNTNWRFAAQDDGSYATDGEQTVRLEGSSLKFNIATGAPNTYSFYFVNSVVNERWLSSQTHVTNTMQ